MTNPTTAPSHLTILTGASRGMGLAMALQLLAPGDTLLCISRHANESLALKAKDAGAVLLQWCFDLADGAAVCVALQQWLAGQHADTFATASFVNNAAMIPAIVPLADARSNDLAQALRVGLEAPMQLTAAFLHATAHWTASRKVLNISSGLARRPMASQAAYCAAKAGMDHFTRCLALEEAAKVNGAKVCSLAPGVIDTDMQLQLRSANGDNFPDQAGFSQLKLSGSLASPESAAASVLAFMARADFGSQPVADVRG